MFLMVFYWAGRADDKIVEISEPFYFAKMNVEKNVDVYVRILC